MTRRAGNHVPNRSFRRSLRRRLNLAVFYDREVHDIVLDVGMRAVRVKSQVEPLHDGLENGTDARRRRLDGRAVLDAVVDRGGSSLGKGVAAQVRCYYGAGCDMEQRAHDSHLDAARDEIDGLGRHERRARRSLTRKLLRKLRPLLRAPELLLPLLVDVAVLGVALQLGEQGARRADLGVIRVLLECVDQLGEDTDGGVRLGHTGVAPGSRDIELERDGALFGDRKEGESLVVNVLDASEALVENKGDAVLAVARFDRFSQRFGRAPTVDLFVKAGREDDVAASKDAVSVNARQRLPWQERPRTHRSGWKPSSMSLSRAAKMPIRVFLQSAAPRCRLRRR